MPLIAVALPHQDSNLPAPGAALLREADRLASSLDAQPTGPPLGFVPCDYQQVARAVATIVERQLATGNTFCEWGSGLGVVTMLASLYGFDACGIEVEPTLVTAAEALAARHQLSVSFVAGSYIPPTADVPEVPAGEDFFWMTTAADAAYGTLEQELTDFAVVFAFPWPSEAELIGQLFEQHARYGALLLTYHHNGSVHLQRKVQRA
ncbi:MAG: hypothetical protein VX346_18010 [Planctomycetota bacterium]|nr:hypothetical protein [Planctomycetota bacterium]